MPPAVGQYIDLAGRAARKAITNPREATLSARLALWVVFISVVARLTSLPRTHAIASFALRRSSSARRYTPQQLSEAIDRVLRIDLPVFQPRCWKRAFVLQRFLARSGVESRINFGVRREDDGTLVGHAWLERDGQPFLESEHGSYAVTFSLPPAPGERALPTFGRARTI